MLTLDGVSWPAIICLAALAGLAERFDWSLYGNSRVSVAFAPILAAAALFGVAGVAVVVPVAIIAGSVGAGRPHFKTAFNFGVLMVAGSVSALVFDLFPRVSEAGVWPEIIVAAILAAALNFVLSTGLVSAAISLEKRGALHNTWKEYFAWLLPHYLVLGLLGVSIAGAYVAFGLAGFVVFLLPPLMMRISLKQYVERTGESMEQLRIVNEELQARNSQLQDARAQAATDSLTGLRNHRAFQERIRDAFNYAEAESSCIGLIMLDVDGFKQLNDSFGHLAGDKVLRDLASALVQVVGDKDAYRYGGDEFAVLLLGMDVEEAAAIAEQLRSGVEMGMDAQGSTISVGVSSYPNMASSAEELIYTADMAMYWAKSAGKNRVGHLNALYNDNSDAATTLHIGDQPSRLPDAVSLLMAALVGSDAALHSHGERCSWYGLQLAGEMGLNAEDTSTLCVAALLHDTANLAVPDGILSKSGSLSKDERSQVRRHATAGLGILGHIPSVAGAAPIILHHHEHFDGSGYPDGLRGDAIPLASRILLVADAFDAMTTDRPYRKALSVEEATEELERNSGSQFDPEVVEIFLRILRRTAVVKPARRRARSAA